MKPIPYIFIVVIFCCLGNTSLNGQCQYANSYKSKAFGISYEIDVQLDENGKKAVGTQRIVWTNPSDLPVHELKFYMYLNAFRNMNSSFLTGSGGEIFGRKLNHIAEEEWGFIHAHKFKAKPSKDTLQWHYIQEDDGNKADASVLKLNLPYPVLPGQSITLDMEFTAKLPGFVVRSGYSREHFYSFLHWFPQLGVYEKLHNGAWKWNCHQFFRQTEFYADFSDFKVKLDVPADLVIGHTGCLVSERYDQSKKRKKLTIEAKDVIDFAWVAYPHFETYTSEWKGIKINLLIPPEHCDMAPRYHKAITQALEFLENKIEKYPYPSITLIDPPMHGLGAGFMEYPMLITCASFHLIPEGIRTVESLAIHEFTHQYFMAILASNEKEEAWLDEGFVTFFEDEIMDHYYGSQTSVWDIFGYRSGNKEMSRLEFSGTARLGVGPIARPGWELPGNYYKQLVYAKTATVLQTMKGLLSEETFYDILRLYYKRFQFKHPKEADFIECVKDVIGDEMAPDLLVDDFFKQTLHQDVFCDYYIHSIEKKSNNNYLLKVGNHGQLLLPQEIKVKTRDGNEQIIYWDGKQALTTISVETASEIQEVIIDEERKIYLDINFINNAYRFEEKNKTTLMLALRSGTWFRFIAQSLSFLA